MQYLGLKFKGFITEGKSSENGRKNEALGLGVKREAFTLRRVNCKLTSLLWDSAADRVVILFIA